jgi:hypothetical protein
MNAYRVNSSVASLFLTLGTPRWLYPQKRTPVPIEKKAVSTFWRRGKFLSPVQFRISTHPARSLVVTTNMFSREFTGNSDSLLQNLCMICKARLSQILGHYSVGDRDYFSGDRRIGM